MILFLFPDFGAINLISGETQGTGQKPKGWIGLMWVHLRVVRAAGEDERNHVDDRVLLEAR